MNNKSTLAKAVGAVLLAGSLGLAGCNLVGSSEAESANSQQTESIEQVFALYSDNFIKKFWQYNPWLRRLCGLL